MIANSINSTLCSIGLAILFIEFTFHLKTYFILLMSSLVKQVEAEAQKAFEQNPTSLAGPRAVYSQALEKRLQDLTQVNSAKEKTACESDICNLYVSRAAMEINCKQKKQAKLVFDEALKHDFCNRSNMIWKAYINFCIREGKAETARKHFRTAVDSVDVSV